jgi:hypothetical protein
MMDCEACEFDMCFEHDPGWASREEVSILTTPHNPMDEMYDN